MTAIEDRVAWFLQRRRETRVRQARHLVQCGARPVLEALIAVDKGGSIDAVLADFARIEPQLYHACIYHYTALNDDEGEK